MNSRITQVLGLASIALVVGAAPLAGCQSKTDKARNELVSQAGDFRQELQRMPAQIDETTRLLVAATAGQNPTRPDDFRSFNKSLETLRKQAAIVGREADAAEVDAAKYFEAWAKETQRAKTVDRQAVRAEAAASRAQVNTSLGYLQKAREDFHDLLAAYDNVSKRMSKDLSEAAILAVQPDVNAAITKSVDVRNGIERLDDAIDAALAKK